MNEMLNRLGMNAKAAETEMRNLSTNKKNEVLLAVADPGAALTGHNYLRELPAPKI